MACGRFFFYAFNNADHFNSGQAEAALRNVSNVRRRARAADAPPQVCERDHAHRTPLTYERESVRAARIAFFSIAFHLVFLPSPPLPPLLRLSTLRLLCATKLKQINILHKTFRSRRA